MRENERQHPEGLILPFERITFQAISLSVTSR